MLLETKKEVEEAAGRLTEAHQAEKRRLDPIHAAVRGEDNALYVPQKATEEYRRIVEQSRFNVLPLVITQLAQALFVDGYLTGDGKRSPVWEAVWQPNRMDARQGGLYRSAIEYGASYALGLPGDPVPVITPLSPRRCTALYEDPVNDEWPELALVFGPKVKVGEGWARKARLFDEQQAHPMLVGESGARPAPGEKPKKHGLGVVPLVRYLDSLEDLDDGPCGKVEPLVPVQRQLNQTTYSLLMAQHYGAFRQRWVTGMLVQEDADGNPREPFDVGVDRMLHAEEATAKFGDFAETSLDGYLKSREAALLFIASVAQIPPHNLIIGSGISNISAEALAALEAGHRQDVAEHQQSFGESTEQLMRLCGRAMGDEAAWKDTSGQVIWRDTTPRSLAQVADAWGKVAQMLGVPPRALWSRLPGVTQQDVRAWERMADEQDALLNLEQMFREDAEGSPAGEPEPEPAPSAAG
ncbi:phage portal protein [Streptomyces aidingensis]|uniref:Phage portal protein, SPP1 Gp6-like n=1 Tax=Streptomyces aidingensis TaxID=910347 RepID=A0A1I1Q7Z2_9ACTN|nr:phage portal protein [Streptomyces aidingensis]SFD14230.1 Phage portal protein, SPP1 Gp6-like [Streptomyces aidingensis]